MCFFACVHASRISGNTGALQQNLQNIEKIDPLNVHVIFEDAYSRKFTKEEYQTLDARISKVLELTDDRQILANLYFARGKIAADTGLHDIAFEAFKRANDYYACKANKIDLTLFENSRAVYTKSFFNLRTQFGSPSSSPIFIIGMPRSGTTLIESICGAHSQVTSGDELEHIVDLGNYLGDLSPNLAGFRETVERLSHTETREMGRHYLEETGHLRVNSPKFTDKMPHNFLRLGLIHLILPNASVIHVRRHPIDNCRRFSPIP